MPLCETDAHWPRFTNAEIAQPGLTATYEAAQWACDEVRITSGGG